MKNKDVHGEAKNVYDLLSKTELTIDYFQREYSWKREHVHELIYDLFSKFSESHKREDEPDSAHLYKPYFLGSIIVSVEEDRKTIIDGQQRLTTLTLLLIYLFHRIKEGYQDSKITDFFEKYGTRISTLIYFQEPHDDWISRLNIPERTPCMKALFRNEEFDGEGQSDSVLNILDRYKDIGRHFPEELTGEVLLCFTEWLLSKVYLVEIISYSGIDGFIIFETVNDRGLPLTFADKLKGFLLFKISDAEQREHAGRLWDDQMSARRKYDEESYFLVNWLLSQYAKTIGEFDELFVHVGNERNLFPIYGDVMNIQWAPYRWVHKYHQERLGLKTSSKIFRFITKDFVFFSSWYQHIKDASEKITKGLEEVYLAYGGELWSVKIPYVLFLAPLRYGENREESLRKIRIVAKYADILMSRLSWNKNIKRKSPFDRMDIKIDEIVTPELMMEIREKPARELVEILIRQLKTEKDDFNLTCRLRPNRSNRFAIRRLLARITHFIEIESGLIQSHYEEYLQNEDKKHKYEIEHILSTVPKGQDSDFENRAQYRDYIGSLLLLPRGFNASYGDKSYSGKLKHYYGQNLLAQSLNKRTYENNPGFLEFIKESKLPFKKHPEFKKEDLDERQELYHAIAKKIWDPETLRLELEN